jgi:hypothetical protein
MPAFVDMTGLRCLGKATSAARAEMSGPAKRRSVQPLKIR